VINNGRGFVGGPLPPGTRFALSEQELEKVPGYKGDMEPRWAEARKLLAAAGVPEGTTVELMGRDLFENWALVFADGLGKIGLKANITLHERGKYDERLAAKDYGDMSANSRTAVFADPTPVFGDNYVKGAGRHYTDLVIPEVEDLFVRQEQELDPDKRLALAKQMQKAYLDVYPAEIAAFVETRQAMYNNVKGYGELYGTFYASRKFQWLWLDK
jgi:ABC-type transport system substrate-binding protein